MPVNSIYVDYYYFCLIYYSVVLRLLIALNKLLRYYQFRHFLKNALNSYLKLENSYPLFGVSLRVSPFSLEASGLKKVE